MHASACECTCGTSRGGGVSPLYGKRSRPVGTNLQPHQRRPVLVRCLQLCAASGLRVPDLNAPPEATVVAVIIPDRQGVHYIHAHVRDIYTANTYVRTHTGTPTTWTQRRTQAQLQANSHVISHNCGLNARLSNPCRNAASQMHIPDIRDTQAHRHTRRR